MNKSILETVHESAKSLYNLGMMDTVTMREFDAMCLPQIKELNSIEIKTLRLREKLSQPVFAHVLNVSSSTVKHWEAGDKQPSGSALKLLNIVSQKGIVAIL